MFPSLAAPNCFQPALQQEPKEKFLDQGCHDDRHYYGDGDRDGIAATEQLFGLMIQFRLLIGRSLRGIRPHPCLDGHCRHHGE